jgi:hypothetical protein
VKINVNRLAADVELLRLLREIAAQVNGLSEGNMSAHYGARTAAPTTGTWNRGDKVRNSEPAELGAASSRYVIDGWICIASGTPGTWVQQRTLTGN